MARISLDKNNKMDMPTLILQNKNFDTIGKIANPSDVVYKENFNAADEFSFTAYNDETNWDSIINYKVLYVPELQEKFEIKVNLSQEDTTIKNITGTSLCEAELGQVILRNIEINTDNDTIRKDYDENFPTIFYRNQDITQFNWDKPEYNGKYKNYTDYQKKKLLRESSLLHRLFEKVPNYTIGDVDASLRNLQRIFSISNTDLYGELTGEVATAFNCIFIFDSMTRTVNAHDLYNTCKQCGYRGDFIDACPECGSVEYSGQYGNDTTILISRENLAQSVTLEENEVKNCFYVEGGDDIMNAAIISINPSNSPYIYNFGEETLKDMPVVLRNKLEEYKDTYKLCEKCKYVLGDDDSVAYNDVITYINNLFGNKNYKHIPVDPEHTSSYTYALNGYGELVEYIYQTTDMYEFVYNAMMPTIDTDGLDIQTSMRNIIDGFEDNYNNVLYLSKVSAVTTKSYIESTIKKFACVFFSKAYYDFSFNTSSISYSDTSKALTWNGTFKLVSLTQTDENNKPIQLIGDTVILTFKANTNDDHYSDFIRQTMNIKTNEIEKLSERDIIGFPFTDENQYTQAYYNNIANQLHYYSYAELDNLRNAVNSCCEVLAKETLEKQETSLGFYMTVCKTKLSYIDSEMNLRNNQIKAINVMYSYNYDETKETYNISGLLDIFRRGVQEDLDLEKFLGTELYTLFCSYKREDTYSNSNYISTGLENNELLQHAIKLLDIAKKELFKASHPQYSFSSSINNLLSLPEFNPIKEQFYVGNWIRLRVEDAIYRLRLLSYQINFDNPEELSVEFSTLEKLYSGLSDLQSVISAASSMSTSYDAVMNQMDVSNSTTARVNEWVKEGLNATKVKYSNNNNQELLIDEHGLLARQFLEMDDEYDPHQLKVLSNGLYLTNDNWNTIHTGIGRIAYTDPVTGNKIDDYGIIAKTVVGKLILGENLGIYNNDGSLTFDINGFAVKSGTNSVVINPKDGSGIFKIKKNDLNLLYTDGDGNLNIVGALNGGSININNKFKVDSEGNVSLPSGTKISWNDVTDTDDIATKPYVTSQGYQTVSGVKDTIAVYDYTEITEKYVTSPFIATLNLEVGNEIKMGANATITWNNVTNQPTIPSNTSQLANDSNFTTESQVTEITEYTIKTTNVVAQNLHVNAACVDGEFIGKTIKGGTIGIGGSDYTNFYVDGSGNLTTKGTMSLGNGSLTYDVTNGMSISANMTAKSFVVYDTIYMQHYGDNTPKVPVFIMSSEQTPATLQIGNSTNTLNMMTVIPTAEFKNHIYTEKNILVTGDFGLYSSDMIAYICRKTVVSNNSCTQLGNASYDTRIYGSNIYKGSTATAITSDKRLKENVNNISSDYEKLFMLLNPVSFAMKNGTSKRLHMGFIAQEVKDALDTSGVSTHDFAGYVEDSIDKEYLLESFNIDVDQDEAWKDGKQLYVRYEEFIALNTHMIQKALRKIDEQQKEIESLKNELQIIKETV